MTLASLSVADPPDAWREAGFTVDADGRCAVGTTVVQLGAEGRRLTGWSLRGLDGDGDLDGLPTTRTHDEPVEPGEHPNGAIGIDHVVVASADIERTTAAFEAAGLRASRTRDTDSYGAPMRQRFFRMGPVVLELVGPPEPDGSGRPTDFFGLAVTVADLDAAKSLLGAHLGEIKDAVQPGRRIVTLRGKPLGISVPIAFMSPEP